ncbi:tetratricopeptide repeat protein [Chryseolinea lacunae]|uniref:Tetratricopeptide repeat protein n=1 Tax=Chryseolinea lacunae TaxID=2801331 RepID=A0ABS1KKA6_9BACT|nr:tetratricopeptide repeat protein [Chryseolinea lacunae]MBL0739884.1 tetratricopeptide repeat protein [Chryseolinea lacunae]
MTDSSKISRISILIQQKKYAEAERHLRIYLTEDPNNIMLLSLLAEAKLLQDQLDEALAIVNNAIGIAPDADHLFYIRARIDIQQDRYDDAEQDIAHALAIDPNDADYYAFHASIKLDRKQYDDALNLANKALERDAENLLGLNIRSTALLKLNRKEDSFNTIEGALREDPNNAFTHANYGWGLLEKGDHKKALEHFKESLKIDPNFMLAQAGMVEALKASNPVYRLFLKYSFWMGNMTSKYQWGVIFGFYFGVKFLKGIANSNDTLRPYLMPIVVVLSLLAFSTWIMNPIGNLFLRLNRYGNFLLDKNEKMSSNFVGISLLVCIAGLLSYFILKDDKLLTIAAFGLAMMLPFGSMFAPSKYKHALLIYAVVMAAVGLAAIALTFQTGEMFNVMTPVFLIGFIGFQWAANYLMISAGKK